MHSSIPPRTAPLVADTPVILPALLLCDFGHLADEITKLEEEFPAFILNSRGSGLFCSFDLPSSDERDKLSQEAYKNKLMILVCGIKSIRFRPHLTVTKAEIDFGIDVIKKSINNILK